MKGLGQSVVFDNQSGGGGVVASLATARAAPDGYTLMLGYVATHGTSPAVRKLPYDAKSNKASIERYLSDAHRKTGVVPTVFSLSGVPYLVMPRWRIRS